MINAYRDENGVPTKTALSNADGVTTLPLELDPTTHGLSVNDDTTGSPVTSANADRDDNHVPVMMAVSSADGVTPVPLVIDSVTGKLLVNSN